MHKSDESFFTKEINPVFQGTVVLGISLFFMLGAKVFQMTGIFDNDPTTFWTVAATFVLFFAIFNSLFSLSTSNMDQYWTKSMLSFVGLAAISGGAAWLLSGVALDDAGSYRWIFIVLTIGYLVFLSIMGAMRSIVDFAQKEEWNQPRIRKKRRKKGQ